MSRIHRVNNFINFAGELQRRAPSSVLVEANKYTSPLLSSNTTAVGRIGEYVHGLHYTVATPKRPLHYRENLFSAFQSERGSMEAQLRDNRVGSLILAAEVRVDQLRLILPGADVQIGSGQGELMTAEDLERVHQEMAEQGVVSAIPTQTSAWLA